MAAHLLLILILTAATLWGQPPRGEIAPFGFTPDGAARYWATPAGTAWVWLGEWRPVPITGMEARVSAEGVLTLVDVEALAARAASLEARIRELQAEVRNSGSRVSAATIEACQFVERASNSDLVLRDCAGQQVVVRLASRRPCTLSAWIDANGKIAWGGCVTEPPGQSAYGGVTVPTFARYIGAARAIAPCKPQPLTLTSFGWGCAAEVSEVFPALRPTDVVPRWQ